MDWILFGGIFSAPVFMVQTDWSMASMVCLFSLPLHLVSAVSAFFAVLWSGSEGVKRNQHHQRFEDLLQQFADEMVMPVLFYCGLLMLFSESLSSVILYGSITYLFSIAVFLLRKSVKMRP
ncbi:MAG: hypothetical protein ACOYNS_18180 [Bacteroidota bacterium]